MKKRLNVEIIPGMGRGVITEELIKEGEIIAHFELLVFSPEETIHLNKTKLGKYTYCFDAKEKQDCLALGEGALLNHSDEPNASFSIVIKENRPVLELVSKRDIVPGEQILIHYGSDDELFDLKRSYYFE